MYKKAFGNINNSLLRIISLFVSFSLAVLSCSCSKKDNDFDGSRFAKTRHISVLVDSDTDFEIEYDVDSSCVAHVIQTHYQRNANQNHNEVPLHASQNGCNPKVYKQ